MEKLLNMTRRQILAVSWGAVALGIAGILTVGLATADHVRQANQVFTTKSDTPADTIRSEQPAKPTQAAPDSQQSEKAATQATKPIAQPQQAETKPQPTATAATPHAKVEPIDGGHIPFTNLPVVPGDPLSYVGTVGQCPFYEIAGEKGCNPPSDIVCNSDWTICKPIEDLGL